MVTVVSRPTMETKRRVPLWKSTPRCAITFRDPAAAGAASPPDVAKCKPGRPDKTLAMRNKDGRLGWGASPFWITLLTMSDSFEHVSQAGDSADAADAGTSGEGGSGHLQAFPQTHWTQVRQSAGAQSNRDGQQALEQLCQDYWYPLYAFARRRGSREEDARDLVQGFFAHVIRTRLFGKADPQAGRLRSFLLKCFVNFSTTDYQSSQSTRRRPQAGFLSTDWEQAERNLAQLADSADTPEECYDRNWGMEMLHRALTLLEAGYQETGRGALFSALRPFLDLGPPGPAVTAAAEAQLNLSPNAMRQAVHRLRIRFGQTLRQLIADTLETPTEEEVAFEMQTLRRAVAGK